MYKHKLCGPPNFIFSNFITNSKCYKRNMQKIVQKDCTHFCHHMHCIYTDMHKYMHLYIGMCISMLSHTHIYLIYNFSKKYQYLLLTNQSSGRLWNTMEMIKQTE